MRIARCIPALLLLLPLLSVPTYAQSEDAGQVTDQIVRLSYVQGDVRVARGKPAEHATGGDWGQAQANLPILTGFSLVTGDGRAEIELEDASTVYLGENSVLTFDLLADEGEVPHTVLTLVSGVATVHVTPVSKAETFVLNTPTSRLSLRDDASAFLRVHSYLDAARYVSLAASPLVINGGRAVQPPAGQAVIYHAEGHVTQQMGPEPGSAKDPMAAWDAWTIDRIRTRDREMAAALRDSGLTEPLPGLNQLEQSGHFFSCKPYGSCWAPNPPAGAQRARLAMPPMQGRRPHLEMTALFRQAQYIDPALQDPLDPYGNYGYLYGSYPFPCIPGGVTGIAWIPGRGFDPYNSIYGNSYDWALCHEGSWIARNQGYVWVAGERKHHHCPVRWIKYHGKTGFVPLNPRDEKGRLPINLEHGVFLVSSKNTLEYTRVPAGTRIKRMNEAPGEFRRAYYPPLRNASAPRPIAYALAPHSLPARAGGRPIGLAASEPVRIGRHAEQFSLQHQEFNSGHARTITGHFGGTAGVMRAASPGVSGIRGGFSAARGSSFGGGGAIARAAVSSGGGAMARGGGESGGIAHGGGGGGGGVASHGGGAASAGGAVGGGGHH